MSAITSAQQGLEAVERKDWAAAIPLLSRGIDASGSPNPSPVWLLARAQAYQQQRQYARALADAERAYTSALARQQPKTRELLTLAQYRRAVTLASLGRFADADACCVWSQQLAEGKNLRTQADDPVARNIDAAGNYLATAEQARSTAGMPTADKGSSGGAGAAGAAVGQKVDGAADWMRAYMWRSMVLKQMEALPADAPGRKVTVLRVPDPKHPTVVEEQQEHKTPDTMADTRQAQPRPAANTPSQTPAAPKLRVDMYQTADKVSLTLYAKGVDAAALQVETRPTRVRLSPLPVAVAGPSQAVVLVLGGAISVAADAVTARVTPYKIELSLTKQTPGEKWGSWGEQGAWEADDTSTATATTTTTAPAAPETAARTATRTAAPASAPAYPTSSRTGPKDWEKVVAEETGGKDGKGGKDGDDDGEASDVNGFFKSLYAKGTPEQQRAMMKSFVESNGTTLSMDWASVSSGPVETKPPEGVEAKKW